MTEPAANADTPGKPESNFYAAIGGAQTFDRLVSRFYAGVADDPLLRPLYPEADLGPAATRLRMFLEQYWGGPTTYSQLRGHPRLRLRHAPYQIGPAERDAWLSHMARALAELGLPQEQERTMWTYLERAAEFMINTEQTGDPGASDPGASGPGASEPGASEPGASGLGANGPGATERRVATMPLLAKE